MQKRHKRFPGVSRHRHFLATVMVHLAEEGDKYCCSRCRSCHVDIYRHEGETYQSCLDCGHEEAVRVEPKKKVS